MLYETAARASEILALNVEDLDLEQRRAPIRSKGGDTESVYWDTRDRAPAAPAAAPARRHLPHQRAAVHGRPQARLAAATGDGLELHQLRHSAAPHLGGQKVPLQLIMAKTRHKSPRTAMRYVKPGDAAVAEVTSLLGPPRRSHSAWPLLCGWP